MSRLPVHHSHSPLKPEFDLQGQYQQQHKSLSGFLRRAQHLHSQLHHAIQEWRSAGWAP